VRPMIRVDFISGQAADITLRIGHPQMEKLPAATSPVPASAAADTRAKAVIHQVPLTALGLASQDNEYTIHFAPKMLFSSAVSVGGFFNIQIRDGTSVNDRLAISIRDAGTVRLTGTVNGNAINLDVTGLTWAVGDVLNIRFSKGLTNGWILRVNSATAATNTTANAKAAFGSPLTLLSLNQTTDGGSPHFAVYRGFKIWNRALSDAELSALSASDLSPVNTFGVAAAPPWGFPSSNLQEGDQVYMRKISGVDGVFTAEALGFVPAGRSTIEIHAFNAATQRWLVIRRVAFFPGKAMKVTRRDILSIYYMTGAKMDIVRAFVMQDGLKKEIF